MSCPALALHPRSIGVADWPPELFEHGRPHHATEIRLFLPCIETLMSDDEAWERLFTDEVRLRIFRTLQGNKNKRPRPPKPQPASLFDDRAEP